MTAFIQVSETMVNVDHIKMITPGEIGQGYVWVELDDGSKLQAPGTVDDVKTAVNLAVSRAGGHPPMETR